MLLSLLDGEDRSLLEGMYEGLGQAERDPLLHEAVRILRARGWRRPELAGEDLEKLMKELLLQRNFGPERLRKYRDRLEAQAAREGPATRLSTGSDGDAGGMSKSDGN